NKSPKKGITEELTAKRKRDRPSETERRSPCPLPSAADYELPPMVLATPWKVPLALVPRAVMATRQTTMIRDSITAYSTAVGPSSLRTKSTRNLRMGLNLSEVKKQGTSTEGPTHRASVGEAGFRNRRRSPGSRRCLRNSDWPFLRGP